MTFPWWQEPGGGAGGSEEELLVATLATREVLNLLDNFEHLIDEAARIVDLLLARCGRLSVLATSREARL